MIKIESIKQIFKSERNEEEKRDPDVEKEQIYILSAQCRSSADSRHAPRNRRETLLLGNSPVRSKATEESDWMLFWALKWLVKLALQKSMMSIRARWFLGLSRKMRYPYLLSLQGLDHCLPIYSEYRVIHAGFPGVLQASLLTPSNYPVYRSLGVSSSNHNEVDRPVYYCL